MNPSETLAARVLKKEPPLTAKEIEEVVKMDMGFDLKEITISCAETRQVRQYESNNYFVSLTYQLEGAVNELHMALANAKSEKEIEEYFRLKKILFQLISDKYAAGENYLRDLIKKQQEEDGIKR